MPQVAQRPAQALERCPRLACTSTAALAPARQQPLPQQVVLGSQQTAEEGLHQRHQQEQLAAGFPLRHAGRLPAPRTFAVAATGRDLPAACRRQHHLPGRFLTRDGLVGRTVTTVRRRLWPRLPRRDRQSRHAAKASPRHCSDATGATAHPRAHNRTAVRSQPRPTRGLPALVQTPGRERGTRCARL